MYKLILIITGLYVYSYTQGQDSCYFANRNFSRTIETQSIHNLVYYRIPNNIWFFVAPLQFNKTDVFDLKVKAPSVIEKKENNRYLLTPFPERYGFVTLYIYKNNELIDSLGVESKEAQTPVIITNPHVNCRTGFYIPYVNYIECEIIWRFGCHYKLRVESFQFQIKDTNGVVKYRKFVKGSNFSEEDKSKMKKVIDELKVYLFDYIDVHVTDDKYYQATFSEMSISPFKSQFRFHEQE